MIIFYTTPTVIYFILYKWYASESNVARIVYAKSATVLPSVISIFLHILSSNLSIPTLIVNTFDIFFYRHLIKIYHSMFHYRMHQPVQKIHPYFL